MKLTNQLDHYKGFIWKREINVRDFIQHNYTPYEGDESFLVGPTQRTLKIWNILTEMFKTEREKGVYDAETRLPQTLTTYGPGYISKEDLLRLAKPLKKTEYGQYLIELADRTI